MYYITTLNYSQGHHDFLSETHLALDVNGWQREVWLCAYWNRPKPPREGAPAEAAAGRRCGQERGTRLPLALHGPGSAPAAAPAVDAPRGCRLHLSPAAVGPRSDSPWAWRSERAAAGWPPGGKALSNPRVSVRPAAASRRQQLRPRAPRGGAAALSAGPGGAGRGCPEPAEPGAERAALGAERRRPDRTYLWHGRGERGVPSAGWRGSCPDLGLSCLGSP